MSHIVKLSNNIQKEIEYDCIPDDIILIDISKREEIGILYNMAIEYDNKLRDNIYILHSDLFIEISNIRHKNLGNKEKIGILYFKYVDTEVFIVDKNTICEYI